MSNFNIEITSGVELTPPIITVYGIEGIGKSTFGAQAPDPVFIRTEDGVSNLDVAKMPIVESFEHLMAQLGHLAEAEHGFKTVVIDTLDHLEPHIHNKVARNAGKGHIEEIGYGKGYMFATDVWYEYLKAIKFLTKEKGMIVVQLAHSEIKRFDDPETDSYDTYRLKLHKSSNIILEESDAVFFANRQKAVAKEKVGFNSEKKRAVDTGGHVIYTQHRAAFYAKNRYGLPESIPFTPDGAAWGVIAQHVPFLRQMVGG